MNASSRSWLKLPNMMTTRYARGSLCTKKVLFVFGGRTNFSHSNSVSVDYLPLDGGNWQHGEALTLAVYWPKVADINGNVYVLDAECTKQLLQLDPEKKIWNKRASLPVDGKNCGVSMIAVNGRLCVARGPQRICAFYTPETDTWCMEQQPNKIHNYGSLVHNDNTLMLLRGSFERDTDEAEELNLEDGSWSISNLKMPTPLKLHYALALDVSQQD